MSFELRLALRHLRSGGSQTLLVVAGVAVAVILVIFISSLIYGVQRRLVEQTTGSISLVTISVPEIDARPPQVLPGTLQDAVVLSDRRKRPFTRDVLDDWRYLEGEIASLPHVTVVSPGVTGQALITHLGREASVRLIGAMPEKQDRIMNVSRDLVAGKYLGLGAREAVIGYKLGETLGVALGDRVRLVASEGANETFTVAGIIHSGQDVLDEQTVLATLRAAQSLLDKGTGVTSFSTTLDDRFAANRVADLVEGSLALKAESWMRQNDSLLSALRAQSGSSLMISVFSLLAAGFAIASVMIVSVLKRSAEIGILMSMGARPAQILRIFTLEGLGIGIVGALLGAAIGVGLVSALQQIPQPSAVPGRAPEPLFPAFVSPGLVLTAMASALCISIVAGVLPARQASRLDPVEALRRG